MRKREKTQIINTENAINFMDIKGIIKNHCQELSSHKFSR